jgi:PAS domain S-box-containing protein
MLFKLNNIIDNLLRSIIYPLVKERRHSWGFLILSTILTTTFIYFLFIHYIKDPVCIWMNDTIDCNNISDYTLNILKNIKYYLNFLAVGLSILCIYQWKRYSFEDNLDLRERQKRLELIEQMSSENIAYRKALEEKSMLLEEKTVLYQMMFEASGTAMMLIEDDRTISKVNSKFYELTGYKPQEIENKIKFDNLIAYSNNELQIMIERHNARRIFPDATINEYNFHLLTKLGEVKYIKLNVNLIKQYKLSIVSLVDITEFEKIQKELKDQSNMCNDIIRNADGYIWEKDEHGNYLFCDAQFCKEFFGLQINDGRCTQALGQNDITLINQYRNRTGNRHAFGEACVSTDEFTRQQGKKCRFIEMGVINNELYILDVTKTPRYDEVGNYIGIVGFAHNRSIEGENVIKEIERTLKQNTTTKLFSEKNIGIYWVHYEKEFHKIEIPETEDIDLP